MHEEGDYRLNSLSWVQTTRYISKNTQRWPGIMPLLMHRCVWNQLSSFCPVWGGGTVCTRARLEIYKCHVKFATQAKSRIWMCWGSARGDSHRRWITVESNCVRDKLDGPADSSNDGSTIKVTVCCNVLNGSWPNSLSTCRKKVGAKQDRNQNVIFVKVIFWLLHARW